MKQYIAKREIKKETKHLELLCRELQSGEARVFLFDFRASRMPIKTQDFETYELALDHYNTLVKGI